MKVSYIICALAAMLAACSHDNVCANVRDGETPDASDRADPTNCIIVDGSGTVTLHQDSPLDGGAGGGPGFCQSTPTYAGAQDEIAVTYTVAPTWRYISMADLSVSGMVPSLSNPLNIGWTIRVYADDGTGEAPTTPPTVIAKSDQGGAFDPPLALTANVVYWIAAKAVSNGMSEYLTLLTSDVKGEPMMWWDGIFWQTEADQAPRSMVIEHACP